MVNEGNFPRMKKNLIIAVFPLLCWGLLSPALHASQKRGHERGQGGLAKLFGGGNKKTTENKICQGDFLSQASGALKINIESQQERISPGQFGRIGGALKNKGWNPFKKRAPKLLHAEQLLVGKSPRMDLVLDEGLDQPFRLRVALDSSGGVSAMKLEESGAYRPICSDAQLASVVPYVPSENVAPDRLPTSVRAAAAEKADQRRERRGLFGKRRNGERRGLFGRKIQTQKKIDYYNDLTPLERRDIEDKERQGKAMTFVGADVEGSDLEVGGIKTEGFVGAGVRKPINEGTQLTFGAGSVTASDRMDAPSETGGFIGVQIIPNKNKYPRR